jgi:hypothetical protein
VLLPTVILPILPELTFSQEAKKTFDKAINAPDVETNDKGEVAIHGTTYIVWTTKIPEDGRENLTDVERLGA